MRFTKKKRNKLAETLNLIGSVLIFLALFLFVLTFGQVATQEVRYTTKTVLNKVAKTPITPKEIKPPNTDFALVIPKIDAVAPVFANIDPFNSQQYLGVLKKGVAHAKGSALPGQKGNVYVFAHSTDAFYNVGRYNAVFYLLGKLETNDDVYIYYKGEKITYKVSEVKVVSANALKYLDDLGLGKTLTLQTCYPPGTTYKRLIVVAKEVGDDN